ncbi:DNA damage-binding protein 1 [Saccharata proteae CBS 121410]|uniref:DNA damage-binding protein 1 n=1 Tax=Saccharata proteae CBS 121410 TaxID=1314787 RepID=A0A9P4HPP1_9PEZI|nr:DNA damage-binding protein 1 [Saccharata proteae CBS 121410]
MAYIAPIHRPSSVRHALKLNFLSLEEECLAVAKANRLEFYVQTEDGLILQHTKAIYGKVTMLSKLRPATSSTDHLFVGTDRSMYFTLSWDSDARQLRTEKSYVDLADKAARDIQTGNRCLVDPTGRFMTLELYEGIITVVPLTQKGKRKGDAEISVLGEPVPSRISEMFVRSSAFLHRRSPDTEKPRLAFLYEDSSSKVRLKLRQLGFSPGSSGDAGIAELDEVDGPNQDLELGASHLIPIADPAYGLLVLGETSISYLDDSTNRFFTRPLDEATIWAAWERIDNQRFVLADEYGRLYLLMLVLDNENSVIGWKLDLLGETSRASVLVYLDAGHVYLGSHEGDSQVIRINEKSLEVVQSFSNIAPILDFTIMDMGNRSGEGQSNEYSSGQARIVTGSGAFSDGSLRSVRSGVGLEDHGALGDIGNITNMFSFKSATHLEFVDTLLVSLIDESRVFRFDPEGQVEEVEEFGGLSFVESTLHVDTLANGLILQVTNRSVRLTDLESGMVNSEWDAPEGHMITDVAANGQNIALSVGGIHLVVLSVDGLAVRSDKTYGADTQISCLAVPEGNQDICLVGLWQNSTVSILRISNMEPIQTITLADRGSAVPRNLLLANVVAEQPPTLFIALSDGNVITFSVDPSTFALSNKKSIVLGTQQANFRALPRGDGTSNVFATCEHPSLIYGSEGRLVYSAVTAEKATCVCPFDSEAYPGAIAIASGGELHIAMVDTERTTHVQTLRVGHTVRRIAYSSEYRAFGLGTIKRTLKDGQEMVQSHFKLADEVLFKELDSFALNEDELVESVMRCELDSGTGDLAERFVVGTAYLDDERAESMRGRILVFEVTEDRVLKLITELSVKGACRCLAVVDTNKIVAGLIKTVVVYAFEYTTPSTPFLLKRASFRTSTAPMDISVSGNLITIADLMKSISIIEYTPNPSATATPHAPDSLREVARHFATSWSTAVAEVESNTYLEADAEGNLLVLGRDPDAVIEEDRRRLLSSGEMCLGEMVNRIRRIDVNTAPDAAVVPRAFLATVEGSIHLFALIAPRLQNPLMTLQSNLAAHVDAHGLSPGHIPFNKFRAYRSQVREADEPMRFVDGELLERFLDLRPEVQEEVCRGVDVVGGVEGVRELVEGLRRLC